jgi:selenocysteine-specific elongation factor
VIVGTAGHIDHGKTLLVKALTGTDTDRLKEEKARGITIELGFAYTPLPDGGVLGFVDVPGHERFIHTMLAGASGIDFVLLVIAADDGVMPQTREHLDIINLLGVSDGAIALTKIDLVDDARRRDAEAEIRAALAGSVLAGADIYPVSAQTGDGIAALKQRLDEEAQSRPAKPRSGIFRMAVDRSFTLQGTGTVVTGTALSGSIGVGDSVTVLPQGLPARVRSIHAQNRATERGQAGERCALNLAGAGKDDIRRGHWLAAPARAAQTDRFDARVRLLASAPRAVKTWHPVYFHLGTSAFAARLVLLSTDTLTPGESALAQIVLPEPIPTRHGDRFVLRDIGAVHTIGGGTVIDPRAPARKRRSETRLRMLDAMRTADPAKALTRMLAPPPYLVDLNAFVADRGMTDDEIAVLVEQSGFLTIGSAHARYVTNEAAAAHLKTAIESTLASFHAANPELPGMPEEKLRRALESRPAAEAFTALLAWLAEQNVVVRASSFVRLPTHASTLSRQDTKLWETVRALIEAQRYHPPTAREIGLHLGQPVANIRRLCKTLARMGQLSEVAADRFFLRTALIELGAVARGLADASETKFFSTIAFKDRAGCGRNIAIQVLEYFDRQGITIRSNDMRRIAKDPAVVLAGRRAP